MFRKPYALRRYGPETDEGIPYTDRVVWLNVQPVSASSLQALPEGSRSVKRLKAFGANEVHAADQASKVTGDRLWYRDHWYECESADVWDHTPLSHCESQWVAVPENAPPEPPPEVEVPNDNRGIAGSPS